MTINIGTASGTILINYSQLGSAAAAARTLGLGLVGLGGLAVGAFALAVNSAADFEKAIDHLGAVTNASVEDLELVRQKALEMGRTTVFSAQEAAESFVELGKAGLGVEAILGGVADASVALAAAADIGLTRATEILVNTMRTFQLEASDAMHIADLLAGAANASTVEIEDLAVSLKYAGSVADAVGIPLEEVATALAILGNAGIKGSTAGTSLRRILLELNPASKPAQKALKELGIITADGANQFFTAEGSAKSLAEIFELLRTSTEHLSDAERNKALDIIFGNRAIASAIVLSRDGAKAFEEMSAQINKVTAEDVAAKRIDNLAGALRRFRNTIQAVLIEAGTPFQEFMTKLVDGITGAIEWFGRLPEGVQKGVFAFLALFGVLAILAGMFFIFIGFMLQMVRALLVFQMIWPIIRGLHLFSSALRLLLLPLRLVAQAILFLSRALISLVVANPIVAAIVAIIAILAILYFKVDAVRNTIDSAARGIVSAFKWLVDAGGKIVDFFQNNWQKILGFLFPFIGIPALIVQNWGSITGFFGRVIDSIVSFFVQLPGRVGGAMLAFGQMALDGIIRFVSNIPYWLGFAIGYFVGFTGRMLGMAIEFSINFFNAVISFIINLPARLGAIFLTVVEAVGSWVATMVTKAVELGTDFFNAVVNWFIQLPGRLAEITTNVFNAVAEWVPRMVAQATQMATDFFNAVVNWLAQLPGRVAEFLGNIIMEVTTWAGTMFNEAMAAGTRFYNAIVDGIRGLPGVVGEILSRVIQAFLDVVSRAWNAAKNFASGLWNGFKAGLGIGSPSLIEYAMWDMVDNVTKSTQDLQKQVLGVQKLTKQVNATRLGAIGYGMATAGALGAAGSGSINHTGDHIEVNARTDADAEEIAEEIMWKKRVRIR